MSPKPNVLIADDDPDTRELLADALKRQQFNVKEASSGAQAVEVIRTGELDVVLADIGLGDINGLQLCERIAEIQPGVPVIVVTGQKTMESAIAALRAGAYDFITKPVVLENLIHSVRRAINHRELVSEVRRLRAVVESTRTLEGMLGDSPAIRQVFDLIEQAAPSDASILITGESGTGKELVARALHQRSNRANAPFIAINCAAMPATLLESELFGHVKGAFTDAKRDRPGLFVRATGGTLFLDEIGEMPLEMQTKLLRALQERCVRPVGGDVEIPFDARLITATNRDLESEIEEGRFRSDLYYRIDVVHIEVPPLRARQRDILLLAQSILERIAVRTGKAVSGISSGAAQKLLDYDWPGNVRELENCIERAVALTHLSEIAPDDLPAKVRDHVTTRLVITADDPAELITLSEMEQRYVRRVLAAVGGNKTHAARVLGLDRRSLYRRLERGHGDERATTEPPERGGSPS